MHTACVYTQPTFTQRGFASPSWSPTFRVPPLKLCLHKAHKYRNECRHACAQTKREREECTHTNIHKYSAYMYRCTCVRSHPKLSSIPGITLCDAATWAGSIQWYLRRKWWRLGGPLLLEYGSYWLWSIRTHLFTHTLYGIIHLFYSDIFLYSSCY